MAGFAEILFGLLAVYPEAFGIGRFSQSAARELVETALTLFGTLGVVVFLFAVSWQAESLASSARIRFAALAAAISLGVENLPLTIVNLRVAVIDLRNAMIAWQWRSTPTISLLEAFRSLIPSFAAFSLVAFLFLVVAYRPSPDAMSLGGRGPEALSILARLAMLGGVVALGHLLYFVSTTPVFESGLLSVSFGVRLASLFSLTMYFLFVAWDQKGGGASCRVAAKS